MRGNAAAQEVMERVDLNILFMMLPEMGKMLPVVNNTSPLVGWGRFTAAVGSSVQLSDQGLYSH